MTHGFVRWTLRTSDVAAASAFYGSLLEDGAPVVADLPEALRARGAKPHWLGHLATPDVERTFEAFVARGATRLGNAGLVRDPSGAILALTTPQEPSRGDVVWQQLLTADPTRASRDYAELFGMKPGARVEVPAQGSFEQFSWGSDEACGSIGDISTKPHIHAQWLFFFRVAELEGALSHVRAHGGGVLYPTTLPDGRRVAVCEDAQGAQLALMQMRP